MNRVRAKAKSKEGVVLSNKMNKTVVVLVSRRVKHERYGKYLRKSKKYYVHDEQSICKVGDTVKIVGTRPLSKLKRWKVQAIVSKGVE